MFDEKVQVTLLGRHLYWLFQWAERHGVLAADPPEIMEQVIAWCTVQEKDAKA